MITFNNVTKIFNEGKESECKVLDGLDFVVESGEFVALRGCSGSGKSTILKIIARLENATSGTIEVNGINVSEMKVKDEAKYRNESIGYVVQDFMLIDNYKVYENVILPLYAFREKNKEKMLKVKNALVKVNLLEQANKYSWQLSGGEKQRVAIARAIVNNPAIILADEPTGSLDGDNTKVILELLKALHNDGKTIILVTHEDSVASIADREIFLKYGKTLISD